MYKFPKNLVSTGGDPYIVARMEIGTSGHCIGDTLSQLGPDKSRYHHLVYYYKYLLLYGKK